MGNSDGETMRTVYGPIDSWRFGMSGGIDANCGRYCSFNCVYCQLGLTKYLITDRRVFVDPEKVRIDLKDVLGNREFDMINISGTGEPTLALNISEIIDVAKEFAGGCGKDVGVITNSSLMHDPQVRKDLLEADLVSLKLDAHNEKIFRIIDRPHNEIDFRRMIGGMRDFRNEYGGEYVLQIMFMEQNKMYAEKIREIAESLEPDLIHLNTPTRKHGEGFVLPEEEMRRISGIFEGMKYKMVYDSVKTGVKPVDRKETLARRPDD